MGGGGLVLGATLAMQDQAHGSDMEEIDGRELDEISTVRQMMKLLLCLCRLTD